MSIFAFMSNKKEMLELAVKVIAGAQLIAENAEFLIESGFIKKDMKFRLNILNKNALRFIDEFWKNMSQDKTCEAEKFYQNILSEIEKVVKNEMFKGVR